MFDVERKQLIAIVGIEAMRMTAYDALKFQL